MDTGTYRVNEYFNKQEIQLDGCKLVGCLIPKIFLSHFTTLFSVPNQMRKSLTFQGVGVWQVQHSTRQGDRGAGVPYVGGMNIFWNNIFELRVNETGQWLVKYSISETPHCFFYFILINRKFILQFTLKDHHINSQMQVEFSDRHTVEHKLINKCCCLFNKCWTVYRTCTMLNFVE